ncbi:TonB-dependent siderophore receptor [Luteimonas sp. RIT-PG2_3]
MASMAHAGQAQEAEQDAPTTTKKEDVTDLTGVVVEAKGPPRRTTGGALGGRKDLDTPFSLSTVTAEDIQERQAYSLVSVFAHDAGVSRAAGSDYNGWASRLIVRGLPIDFDESIKINGVPGGFLFGVNLPIEDMDSVQLLKGSSGFMYGFSAPGGIVNYRTKQPTPYELFNVDVGFRSDSLFSQHVDLSGPLASDGRLGYRLNVSREHGTTYSDSDVDRKALALTLNGRITDNLAWTVDVLGQLNDTSRPSPYYTVMTVDGVTPGGLPYSPYVGDKLPPALSGETNPASNQSHISNKFHYLTAGMYWEIKPDWNLHLNASTSRSTFRLSQEYMYFLNREGDYQNETFDGLNIFSADFGQALLQGKFRTGFIEHQPVVGVSWQRRTGNIGRTNYYPGSVRLNQSNIYAPERLVWSPFPGEPTDGLASVTTQRAAFISDTLNFGEKWSFLAGLRYTDYSQMYSAWTRRQLDPEGIYVLHSYDWYKKNSTTPTAALMFKPNEGTTIYASYVESLQQGSTVGNTYFNEGDLLDPLLSKQYELGFKYESASWNASAAAFRIDRGAGYGRNIGEAKPIYVQDGIHRYDGLEVAGTAMLGDSLRIGGSLQYIDGTYLDMAPNEPRIGAEVEGVAKHMASANISYEVPWAEGLSVQADAKYFGETTVNNFVIKVAGVDTLRTVTAAGYTVFNAGGSYRTTIAERPVTFRAQVLNLFDRNYWQGGYFNFAIGAPRTLALNVQMDF